MVSLILSALFIIAITGLLAWTARGITPNKRKPESRYRGKTLADVDAQVRGVRRSGRKRRD